MKSIRQFFSFLKKWFWIKQVSKSPPPKATEYVHNYICIKYHDQFINLRKGPETEAWNRMSRKDRRGMAQKFRMMEKKGKIKFVEINKVMTCVKNKSYEGK